MNIPIRYKGFVVAGISRVYNFEVINALGEARQFSVKVPSDSFRPTLLGFQDGPPITFERLKLEIDAETAESHANPELNISVPEIQEYLVRQHPVKARKKNLALKLPTDEPILL